MGDIGNQDEFLKEREQLLTDEEILELDGIMLGMNEEIMKKAGEIMNILGKFNSVIQTFRDAYCRCKKDFEKTKAALEVISEKLKKEKEKARNIENNYNSLKQSYEELEKENNGLNTKLEDANQENNRLKERIQKMNGELDEKEKDVKETKNLLSSKNEEILSLNEEKQKYEMQWERMPALMRLYHAYQGVMEKKSELPQVFFECMQNVVPLDDFDGFLPGALRESYPINYYQSVQSFITVCNHRGEVSGEALKDSLRILDVLLSAVFDLGSAYWKSEKLFRIDIKAGDPFDDNRCKYIDEKGGLYGDIVEVWLHGFRDENNNETYYSYVEGE